MKRSIKMLVTAVALFGFSGIAAAQTGPIDQPQAPQQQLPKVLVFRGSEDLQNYGILQFTVFDSTKAAGPIEMLDASNRPIRGNFQMNGKQVNFVFTDCTYSGTIAQGGVIAGTARYTSGNNAGHTWNFRVQLILNSTQVSQAR